MSSPRTPAPLFGTVTDEAGFGGIARVSRLAQKALASIFDEELHVIRLLARGGARPTLARGALFAARLLMHKGPSHPWALFDHAGLARVATGRFGLFLHGIEAWDPEFRHYAKSIRRAFLRIAVSRHTAARVREAHHLEERIDVVPLALLPESPESISGAVDEEILSRIGARSVGIIARLAHAERFKGHDELIRAFTAVVVEERDAQLVIVGDGEDSGRLKKLVRAHSLESHVLFTGRVSEATLAKVYERLAIFAMPSRSEGFGLVYLEAMRKGLPCIASVHDAAKEVIADGETGILVDQTDPAVLVEPIVRLLRDPILRRAMGEKGRERERHEFSYERFESNLRGVLESHLLV